jgi:hypothetical protein
MRYRNGLIHYTTQERRAMQATPEGRKHLAEAARHNANARVLRLLRDTLYGLHAFAHGDLTPLPQHFDPRRADHLADFHHYFPGGMAEVRAMEAQAQAGLAKLHEVCGVVLGRKTDLLTRPATGITGCNPHD